jgi:hypothetical protein
MFRLDGKVAVVTGGGRGIGVMMARGLLQAGATVYLSSRKKAELDAAVAELSVHGPVQAIPADLGTIDGVQALAADLADREDAIHALFNNAGAAWGAPFGEFPESGFDKVLDVNVKGVFLLTRALVPMLTAAATDDDPARVINTGSIDGIVPPGQLLLQREQGRRAHADPTSRRGAGAADSGQRDRARAFPIPDDQGAAAGRARRGWRPLAAGPHRPTRRHRGHRRLSRQPRQHLHHRCGDPGGRRHQRHPIGLGPIARLAPSPHRGWEDPHLIAMRPASSAG